MTIFPAILWNKGMPTGHLWMPESETCLYTNILHYPFINQAIDIAGGRKCNSFLLLIMETWVGSFPAFRRGEVAQTPSVLGGTYISFLVLVF